MSLKPSDSAPTHSVPPHRLHCAPTQRRRCAAGPPAPRADRTGDGGRAARLPRLLAHRELLYFLTWRDIKVRYKQTLMGAAWVIIQPLAHDAYLHARLSPLRRPRRGRGALPALRLRGAAPLDVLRQRRRQQHAQPRQQHEPDHEGLLPARLHPGGGRRPPALLTSAIASLILVGLGRLLPRDAPAGTLLLLPALRRARSCCSRSPWACSSRR